MNLPVFMRASLHTIRWYTLLSYKCLGALKPPERAAYPLGLVLFLITLVPIAYILLFQIPIFWDLHHTNPTFTLPLTIFLTIVFCIPVLGICVIWSMIWDHCLGGPPILQWRSIFRTMVLGLSVHNPHLLPSRQFDYFFRETVNDEKQHPLIPTLFRAPPPPGSSITQKDLAPLLISKDRKIRIMAIGFTSMLSLSRQAAIS